MLVKIFDTGTGKAKSAINYLLGDKDHSGKTRSVKPEVLDGDPKTIAQIIDGTDRKWKYTSGAVAFRDSEKPTREQIKKVIDGFEAAFFPALKKEKNFNVLWVLHQDKGNTELHFLIPRTDLATGRALNIHPPGKKSMEHFNAWTAVINQHLGYAQVVPDPLKLALSGFQMTSPGHAKQTQNMQNIHKALESRIRKGTIKNRDQLCDYLISQRVEIHRRGEDYISIGKPGSSKSKRFKGAIYSRNSDYQKILMESNKARVPKTLNFQEFSYVQANLHVLMKERKDFNVKTFLNKKKPRFVKHLEKLRAGSMGKTKTSRVGPISSADFASKPVTSDSKNNLLSKVVAVKALPNASTFRKNITGIRSSSSGSGAGPPMAGNDLASIQFAIGTIQGSIDAAIADVATAKSPAQRASTQKRLSALMMQKMRLEAQLGQAKIREINRLMI